MTIYNGPDKSTKIVQWSESKLSSFADVNRDGPFPHYRNGCVVLKHWGGVLKFQIFETQSLNNFVDHEFFKIVSKLFHRTYSSYVCIIECHTLILTRVFQ